MIKLWWLISVTKTMEKANRYNIQTKAWCSKCLPIPLPFTAHTFTQILLLNKNSTFLDWILALLMSKFTIHRLVLEPRRNKDQSYLYIDHQYWTVFSLKREKNLLLKMKPWSKLCALSACSGVPEILITFCVSPGRSSTKVTLAPDHCE